MNLPNFIVMLHHHIGKDTKQRVMIRVIHKRISKYFKTEISIPAHDFNPTGQTITKRGGKSIINEDTWIKSSNHDYHQYNNVIRGYLDRLNEVWKSLQQKRQPISSEIIIEKMNEVETSTSILDFVNLEIQQKINNNSETTARHYKEYFMKLFTFLNKKIVYDKTKEAFVGNYFPIEDITHNKIKEFQLYLSKYVTVRGTPMSNSTVSKHISTIQTVLLRNPNFYDHIFKQFRGIDLSWRATPKQKLDNSEIERIFTLSLAKGSMHYKCRSIFLCCYYTQGIRIGEALAITKGNIHKGRLLVKMEKTRDQDKYRDILLSNRAQLILEEYSEGKTDEEYIFPFLKIKETNSNHADFRKNIESCTTIINRYLKEIAIMAGVEKTLTTHVARHSFITHSVNYTKDIYLVSKGIGHSGVEVTEGYAELEAVRFDELNAVYQD